MESIHRQLGMGALPAPPLTDYLARSTSFLYAIHGALLLLISTDVRRYRPLVLLFGWSDVLFGATMLWFDLRLGMPLWWSLAEGPGLVAIGVVVVWLGSGVRPARG